MSNPAICSNAGLSKKIVLFDAIMQEDIPLPFPRADQPGWTSLQKTGLKILLRVLVNSPS